MSFFACLDSDNEDGPSAPKVAVKKETTKATPAKNEPVAPSAPSASKAKGESKGKDGEKKHKSKENAPANTKEETASPRGEATETDGPKRDDRGGRGRGRGGREGGRGRGRGREGEEGDRPPRKREFDRRSGTGRTGEQRRGGRGPYGVGNVQDEAATAEKDPAAAEPPAEEPIEGEEAAAPGWAADATEEAPEEPAVEAEPVVPTLSFEEFMAKRNEARSNAEIFGEVAVRTVEAVTVGQVKAREEYDDLVFTTAANAKKGPKVTKKTEQRSTTKAQIVDVGFTAAPSPSIYDDERGGRGGRGRGDRGDRGDRPEGRGRGEGRGGRAEGRGGRGAGRGPRPSNSSGGIDITSADLFPSL